MGILFGVSRDKCKDNMLHESIESNILISFSAGNTFADRLDHSLCPASFFRNNDCVPKLIICLFRRRLRSVLSLFDAD